MEQLNVYGDTLVECGLDPITGYRRDGCCSTDDTDSGSHLVCAVMTQQFLDFTKSQGNDLSTPVLEYGFPGLKPGDRWCLCVSRWVEALRNGIVVPVILEATHQRVLEIVSLDKLEKLNYWEMKQNAN